MMKSCRSFLRASPTAFTAAILVATVAGCSSDIPPTYPVNGKVVFKGGKAV